MKSNHQQGHRVRSNATSWRKNMARRRSCQSKVSQLSTTKAKAMSPTGECPSDGQAQQPPDPALAERQPLPTLTEEKGESNMTEAIHAYPKGISLKEAWNRLGVKKTKFYGLLHAGEIESYHVGKRHLIVDASLDAWIQSRRATPLKTQ